MNFFQRKKILKKTSFTDLVPVRVLESVVNEQGKTDVLVPRFKSDILKRAMQSKHRGEFIIIHLDETGSLAWEMTDGVRTVADIAAKLITDHPQKFSNEEETLERVMKFITILYQERYITFRQLMIND